MIVTLSESDKDDCSARTFDKVCYLASPMDNELYHLFLELVMDTDIEGYFLE